MGDILSDRVGLLLSEWLMVEDAVIELVGVADPDVGLAVREVVELRDSVGLSETVGLAVREGVAEAVGLADSGISAYEIENTGPPPPSAIGTAVGKTIVRVEFC